MIKPQKIVSFADRLRQARLELGARLHREVRQQEIAEEVGVQPSAYSQWENGVKEPRGRAMYESLGRVLGVDPGWLAFGAPQRPLETVKIPKEDESAYPPPKELQGAVKGRRKGNG